MQTTDNRVQSTQKTRIEMRDEICALAHGLIRRGHPPLDVVQALVDGTVAFAGRIGEEAMRTYIMRDMDNELPF